MENTENEIYIRLEREDQSYMLREINDAIQDAWGHLYEFEVETECIGISHVKGEDGTPFLKITHYPLSEEDMGNEDNE